MSAVFAQEMHQSKCGPNAELISPLRRRSIPAGEKVCWGGVDMCPAQMVNISPGHTQHFWLPATSQRGRIRGSWKEGNNRTQHFLGTSLQLSVSQYFTFPFHENQHKYVEFEKTVHKRKWKSAARSILVLEISDSLASAKEMSSSTFVHSDWLKRGSYWWTHYRFLDTDTLCLLSSLHFLSSMSALEALDLTCSRWRKNLTKEEQPPMKMNLWGQGDCHGRCHNLQKNLDRETSFKGEEALEGPSALALLLCVSPWSTKLINQS